MTDQGAIRNLRTYLPSTRVAGASSASHGSEEVVVALTQGRAAWLVLAAHLVELEANGVIEDAAYRSLANALDSVGDSNASGDEQIRAVARGLEGRIDAIVSQDLKGAITLGLAHEEWVATATRMIWRSDLAQIAMAVEGARRTILELADVHAVTIMPAFVGGRPAQPTTLAHFLGGVLGPLAVAAGRLQHAQAAVNRSPLGAGLLAGDLVGSDRGRLAERLGFGGIIPNTMDALTQVEDFAEVIESVCSALAPARRFLREMTNWIRTDPTSFLIDESWSARPEPGQPLLVVAERLEQLVLDCARMERQGQGLVIGLRDLPYGPLGTAWDLVADEGASFLKSSGEAFTAFGAFFKDALIVNRAYLGNRAGRGYTTSGDLAAFLMTEEQLSPSVARAISGLVLARLEQANLEVSGITPDMIDSAALLTIGRELKVEMEPLGRFLAPRRFLERRQESGSPAPDMTRAWLSDERTALERDAAAGIRSLQQATTNLETLANIITHAAAERD